MTGFEPAALWTQTTRSTKLSYTLASRVYARQARRLLTSRPPARRGPRAAAAAGPHEPTRHRRLKRRRHGVPTCPGHEPETDRLLTCAARRGTNEKAFAREFGSSSATAPSHAARSPSHTLSGTMGLWCSGSRQGTRPGWHGAEACGTLAQSRAIEASASRTRSTSASVLKAPKLTRQAPGDVRSSVPSAPWARGAQ